jgi:hypothetical protein
MKLNPPWPFGVIPWTREHVSRRRFTALGPQVGQVVRKPHPDTGRRFALAHCCVAIMPQFPPHQNLLKCNASHPVCIEVPAELPVAVTPTETTRSRGLFVDIALGFAAATVVKPLLGEFAVRFVGALSIAEHHCHRGFGRVATSC